MADPQVVQQAIRDVEHVRETALCFVGGCRGNTFFAAAAVQGEGSSDVMFEAPASVWVHGALCLPEG